MLFYRQKSLAVLGLLTQISFFGIAFSENINILSDSFINKTGYTPLKNESVLTVKIPSYKNNPLSVGTDVFFNSINHMESLEKITSQANLSHNQVAGMPDNQIKNSLYNYNIEYGFDFLPEWHTKSNKTLLYTRIGMAMDCEKTNPDDTSNNFSAVKSPFLHTTKNTVVLGLRLGFGAERTIYKQIAITTDYIHTWYQKPGVLTESMTQNISGNNLFLIGLRYHFS